MSLWLEGRLSRVVWTSPTGYAVIRLETEEHGSVVCVGEVLAPLAALGPGAFATLEGQWQDHPDHGRRFQASGYLPADPRSLGGIEQWIAAAGVPGVGPRTAERVVAHFGLETPRILTENPERLKEIRGLGARKGQALAEVWQEARVARALEVTLLGLGIRPRVIERVRRFYGDNALNVVRDQPFRLCEDIYGVGFRTADRLAAAQGKDPADPARLRAAVLHLLDGEVLDGHCCLDHPTLRAGLARLEVPAAALEEVLAELEVEGRVRVEPADGHQPERLWSASLWALEEEVARRVRDLLAGPRASPAADLTEAQRRVGVQLDPSQVRAVEALLVQPLMVVTGGPGTGKTTLLRVALEALEQRGETWRLASPTGRAARRMEEATKRPASTLHRLLQLRPGDRGDAPTPAPLEGLDGLIVDEASMLDLPLFAAILRALPGQGVRLVLVGDADQLPSVGPGQVLKDLLNSGRVPAARLDTLHRVGEGSAIPAAAAAVHRGQVPEGGRPGQPTDVFLIDREEPDAVRAALLKVVQERLPARGFPAREVQVLTPTRRGALGTVELNAALQERLNPAEPCLRRGAQVWRPGDRVICLRNRYDLEVFNGDVGVVVGAAGGGLVVELEAKRITFEADELDQIELAYALTVHKAQGSEYPAVVLVLHRSHGIQLRRSLFYTALTRAKRFLCVLGDASAWRRAAATAGGEERMTSLARRLSGAREG